MMRSACGRTMRMVVNQVFRPSARAASSWPAGNGLQAATHVFGQVGRAEEGDADHRADASSMRMPSGKTNGSTNCAMNRMVISGTARMSSM